MFIGLLKLIAMLVLGALALIAGIAASAVSLVVGTATVVLGFIALVGVTTYAVIANYLSYKRDK